MSWWLVICAGLLTACQTSSVPMNVIETGEASNAVTIYIASNGWHTTIIVPKESLLPNSIPESRDFRGATFLSFGWGDAEYYPAAQPTLAMTLRAAFRSTPSVINLAALQARPRDVFPSDEIIALCVAQDGFQRLIDYLDRSFARDGQGRAHSIAPGPLGSSRFYPANGEFHLFSTCNTWVAKGLTTAGLPVRTPGVISAEDLMKQVRQIPEHSCHSAALRSDRLR